MSNKHISFILGICNSSTIFIVIKTIMTVELFILMLPSTNLSCFPSVRLIPWDSPQGDMLTHLFLCSG